MNTAQTITLKPEWDEIEKVRNQFVRILVDGGIENNTIQSATIVFSELIENSIKYGAFSSGGHVEACINIAHGMITIEVLNPIDIADRLHLRELDKMIQWIRGFQDPFEAYIEKLKKVAKMPMKDKTSGLGLVRIAYEGGAILDFFINEDSKLNVSAVMTY